MSNHFLVVSTELLLSPSSRVGGARLPAGRPIIATAKKKKTGSFLRGVVFKAPLTADCCPGAAALVKL